MADKGRRDNPDNRYENTVVPKSGVQGILTKQDEIVDKLNNNELKVLESDPSAGGAGAETMTVTGLKSDDEILSVTQRLAGANGTAMVGYSNQSTDALDISWTTDPGAGAVVRVLVRRQVSEANGIAKRQLD